MDYKFQNETKVKEFIRPENLLRAIPLEPGMSVADFGCGNGYYSVASGSVVGSKGQVFALDIMEDALSQTATLTKLVGLHNVATIQCDLEKFGGSRLPDTSCDAVIISGLLHQTENRIEVLREAYRVLRTGGRLLVVEWNPDAMFGPPTAQRIVREDLEKLLQQYSFRPVKAVPAGSFHYALLYSK